MDLFLDCNVISIISAIAEVSVDNYVNREAGQMAQASDIQFTVLK